MKQWTNESIKEFKASKERFNKAIGECTTRGRVISVCFKTKQVKRVICEGLEKKEKKAA